MNKDIINYDKNDKPHGLQISYHLNSNIELVRNYHHGIYHGYQAYFKSDKSIGYKSYCNMGKRIYDEYYRWCKQIQIKI